MARAPKGQVWPCPLPFPEMHSRGCNKRQIDAPRKLAMNFVVLSLDLFHCGRRHFASAVPGLGTKLNLAQWQFIRSLTALVDAWNAEADITPEVMGRSAAKVENVEQLLAGLCEEVGQLAGGLGNYAMPKPSRLQTSWGSRGSPGEVVGHLSHTLDHVAKAIQPERLKFWKTPTFDPTDFLDDANRETFLRPLDYSCLPEEAEEKPPPVRFRVSRKDKLRFVKLLDSSNRLALYPAGAGRVGFECGGFGIPKDAHRDRLVLDARPANTLEQSERRWIKSLGAVSQLQHFFISQTQVLKVFAEDLREYYHAFLISEQRKLRNILKMTVRPSEVRDLRAYKQKFAEEPFLHVALSTMAMGDLNAVAYGQCSHLGVLLQKGVITCNDLLCLKKIPPRQAWTCGLMIDDLVMLEAVEQTATPEDSVCFGKMKEVHRAYEDVGLPRHEGKSVSFAEEASFWGVQIDGVRGDARPNLSRAIPLCRLIVEVVRLGRASVGLLELLAGSLVSIFQLRRRFMSNLQEIYSAQRGRDRRDIVELSAELIDELLTCIPLVLLTKIDFRLGAAPFLVASDASSQLEAAVYADLPPVAAGELHRHCLQKGLWAKLLRPEGAWRREKGILAEDEELPGEDRFTMHPLWQEAVSTIQFQQLGKVRRPRSRRHINVGEINAALAAEVEAGKMRGDSHFVQLLDSQVALAALLKGRSSSASLNQPMKESIPQHIQYNVRPFYGYVESKRNPSDDPTRRVPIRTPEKQPEPWFADLLAGDVRKLDEFLEEVGLSPMDVSELPPESELAARAPIDLRKTIELRKQRRKEKVGKRLEKIGVLKQGAQESTGASNSLCKAVQKNEEEKDSAKPESGERSGDDNAEAELAEVEVTEAGENERRSAAAKKDAEAKKDSDLSTSYGPEAVAELLTFSRTQFLWNSTFTSLEEALSSGPGFLDLYSGSRGVARAAVRQGARWVLCFDLKHSPSEDLSSVPLQELLLGMIHRGFFLAMGAGPVCASFSTAITPPCRTKQYPQGTPWCSLLQQEKNRFGNSQLEFVLRAVRACLERRPPVHFWIENPDSSWIWRQGGKLSWEPVLATDVGDLRVDYCRFGTEWRKRTRFRTNLHVKGQKAFCRCLRPHVQLRGRCKQKKVNYTRLAEPYPRALCSVLAAAMLIDSKQIAARRPLDVGLCAKCSRGRIGEAANPGPRPRRTDRAPGSLAAVSLLEPGTVDLRSRCMQEFKEWVCNHLGRSAFEMLPTTPHFFGQVLIAYGYHCFDAGVPLHYYRQLVAHIQKTFVGVRFALGPAWDVCSRWEVLEPIQHRPPLPEPVVKAMASLGISWGWHRWTAVLLVAFYSASRVGEVLRAMRGALLTPDDLLSEHQVMFLRVDSPKTRTRGAKIQYVSVYDPAVISYASFVWKDLNPTERLFPLTAGAFRSRWDAILRHLQVGKEHRLTPGSLRAGGAVALHRAGVAIPELLWRMRLRHQQTLAFYLQETTASSILPSLPSSVRENIRLLQVAFQLILSALLQS